MISTRSIRLHVIIIFVIHTISLSALTPRLLIILGEQCDFSTKTLNEHIGGIIVRGPYTKQQIERLDLLQDNHLVIIDGPIDCTIETLSIFDPYYVLEKQTNVLDSLGMIIGYATIELNAPLPRALKQIEKAIEDLPTTNAHFAHMDPKDAGRLYTLMMKTDKIFKKHKIPYWANGGTLLGAVRHHSLIPWDDDLDIIMWEKDIPKLCAMDTDLNKEGLTLVRLGDYFKIFSMDGDSIKKQENLDELFEWKYPFLDIFPVEIMRDRTVRYSSLSTRTKYREFHFIEELSLPFEELPFGPMTIPVPHNYTAMLDRMYGPDWYRTTYMQYDHKKEQPKRKIRVALVDIDQPHYELPPQ